MQKNSLAAGVGLKGEYRLTTGFGQHAASHIHASLQGMRTDYDKNSGVSSGQRESLGKRPAKNWRDFALSPKIGGIIECRTSVRQMADLASSGKGEFDK